MSRALLKKISQATAFISLGLGSAIFYKAISKSKNHPQFISYVNNEEARFDKSQVEYKLKSRDDHLKEAQETEYDLLVIGKSTILFKL